MGDATIYPTENNLIEISASMPSSIELENNSSQLREKLPLPDVLCNLNLDPLGFFVGSKGVAFLQYFETRVSDKLTLSTRSSNYFCKTFLRLSSTDERIANILASWGAYFFHKSQHEDVRKHYAKAVALANADESKSMVCNSPGSLLTQISFYLTAMGFFVCQGDTFTWWHYLCKCYELFEQYNFDLRGISKRLGDSNDVKFVLSNFFYHDIMSSHAFIHGPKIAFKHYKELFDDGFFSASYGIDPLQGCLNPIYMLLAEQMEVRAAMRVRRDRLEDILNNEFQQNDDPSILREFELMRLRYLEHCEEMLEYFRVKIAQCTMDESILKNYPEEERVLHREVFKLLHITCKLFWSIYLKRTPPNSFEPQLELIYLINQMEVVVKTKLVVVLCLPLIIAGVTSYTEYDRSRVKKILFEAKKNCPVQNLDRAWFLIQAFWERNVTGTFRTDWADICAEMNWQLCVC